MPENLIGTLTSGDVVARVRAFNMRYVQDWRDWLRVSRGCEFLSEEVPIEVAKEFKRIMGKWQACRPRRLRSAFELQRTLAAAVTPLSLIGRSSLRCFESPGRPLVDAMADLWRVFEDGLCEQSKASEVGVTKAILLVTKGRIGPAFDSNVKACLNAGYVTGPKTHLKALSAIARELGQFETRESKRLEDLALEAGRPADVGRIIDMVLGPR